MDAVLAVLLATMVFANCMLCIALVSMSKGWLHAVCKPMVKVGTKTVEKNRGSGASLIESVRLIDLSYRSIAESYGLSSRETDVFILLVRGKSYAAIADELCICIATVKSHVNKIYGKMKVHSRDELIDMVERNLRPGARMACGFAAVA
jgi:DNA-binding NarL/FixJ family response regulator